MWPNLDPPGPSLQTLQYELRLFLEAASAKPSLPLSLFVAGEQSNTCFSGLTGALEPIQVPFYHVRGQGLFRKRQL